MILCTSEGPGRSQGDGRVQLQPRCCAAIGGHAKHGSLKAADSFYNVATKEVADGVRLVVRRRDLQRSCAYSISKVQCCGRSRYEEIDQVHIVDIRGSKKKRSTAIPVR